MSDIPPTFIVTIFCPFFFGFKNFFPSTISIHRLGDNFHGHDCQYMLEMLLCGDIQAFFSSSKRRRNPRCNMNPSLLLRATSLDSPPACFVVPSAKKNIRNLKCVKESDVSFSTRRFSHCSSHARTIVLQYPYWGKHPIPLISTTTKNKTKTKRNIHQFVCCLNGINKLLHSI